MNQISKTKVATESFSVYINPGLSDSDYEFLITKLAEYDCGDLVDFCIAEHSEDDIEYFFEFQNFSINIGRNNYIYKQG
jgi:hypothetical protein